MQPNAIAEANGVHKLTCRRKEFAIADVVERHIGVFLVAQTKRLKKIDRSFFSAPCGQGQETALPPQVLELECRSGISTPPGFTRTFSAANEPHPVKLASRENKPGGPVTGVTLGHARSAQRRTEIDAMTLDDVEHLQKIERWHEVDKSRYSPKTTSTRWRRRKAVIAFADSRSLRKAVLGEQ